MNETIRSSILKNSKSIRSETSYEICSLIGILDIIGWQVQILVAIKLAIEDACRMNYLRDNFLPVSLVKLLIDDVTV